MKNTTIQILTVCGSLLAIPITAPAKAPPKKTPERKPSRSKSPTRSSYRSALNRALTGTSVQFSSDAMFDRVPIRDRETWRTRYAKFFLVLDCL